jgi:hypothetical protein
MWIFGNKKEKQVDTQEAQSHYAPGTEIAFDSGLIRRFKGHHQTLLKLYGEVFEAAKNHQFDELAKLLKTFTRVFEQHVLEENLRFYIYLEKCLNDSDHIEMIGEMKLEMNQIGRTVRSFTRHHLGFGVTGANVEKFVEELQQIGGALVDRIEREEGSLYTLYLPPRNYEAAARQ